MNLKESRLQKWWMSRHDIVRIKSVVSFFHIRVSFIILGYGIEFKIDLPEILDNLNLINLLTEWIYLRVMKMIGKSDYPTLWRTWRFGEWKFS